MKTILKFLLFLFLLLQIVPSQAQSNLPAFPGAEGHGRYVTGGRGGKIIYVTNLEDDGLIGSFRYAVKQSGARIIMFKTSGTIQLKSELRIENGNITIAGQTAPGDGICLRDYPVKIDADNVIVRFIRFRMGDAAKQEDDALGGRFHSNIIIDHCSMSWSTDECVSFYQNEDFTLQWCLVSESLRNSVHDKGSHGYGGIWGGKNASFHHNLLADHDSRNPRLGEYNGDKFALTDNVDLRNNVIYNWQGNSCYGGEGMNVNIVNCYYKSGPATSKEERIISIDYEKEEDKDTYGIWGKFYIDGNILTGSERATEDNWTYGVYNQFHSSYGTVSDEDKEVMRLDSPNDPGEVTTHTAEEAYDLVLKYVGASLVRDAVDERIISDTKNGTVTYPDGGNGSTNGIIDTQDAVGGWPELSSTEAPTDTDADGIPDDWENTNGLDSIDPDDAQLITVDDEYPNVEVYLNSLVSDIIDNQEGSETEAEENLLSPLTFPDAFNNASATDTLLLASGNYTTNLTVPTGKIITIKGGTDQTPTINFTLDASGESITGGTLIFENLDIDILGNNYFVYLKEGATIDSLVFRNCNISGIGRCLLRTAGSSENKVNKIEIENCIVDGSAVTGYNWIYMDGRILENLTITNSTIYNYTSGESIFYVKLADETNVFTSHIENNTIYRMGNSSSRAILNLGSSYSSSSSYIFRNNIIFDDQSEPHVLIANQGTAISENNLIIGFSEDEPTCGWSTKNDLKLDGLGMSVLTFPNPADGIFSIYTNSPLATAGTDGGCIGDPRWLTDASELDSLATGLAENVDPEAGSVSLSSGKYAAGTELTIEATKNFGYQFVKWVDENGSTLSENTSYTFSLNDDMTVLAVFEAVNVYTLTIQAEGADGYGTVEVSEAGKDGDYTFYEEGTELELTAVSNEIIKFAYWDDATTATTRKIKMDSDVTVSANFVAESYIAAWDFIDGANNARQADYYSNAENVPAISLYTIADNTLLNFRLLSRNDKNAASIWLNEPAYFQTQFSAVGYSNVMVKSSLLSYYYGYSQWYLEYSLDGENFEKADSITINNSSYTDLHVILPDTVNNQKLVYLRWTPNLTSETLGNSTDVDGTCLADIYILADEEQVEDETSPVLESSVPANGAVSASASGQIVFYFNEKVMAGTGDCTFDDGTILEGEFTNKSALYSYSGLDYATEYTFNIPAGAITDYAGNAAESISITFTTMDRPVPDMKGFDFIVDPDATPIDGKIGNTIVSAFASVSENSTTRFLILVKNGTYNEIITLSSDKNNVSLIGQSQDGVLISAKPSAGIGNPVVEIDANNFYAENLTIENTLGMTNGVGVALTSKGEENVYKNVRLLGFQDTQVTGGDRHYYEACEIHGTVDFICGSGNYFYNQCTLYLEERDNNVIVAAATSINEPYGYVFSRCKITGAAINDGQYSLGRPWKNFPRAVFLNTAMDYIPQTEGWTDMGALSPALYAEYNSVNKNGVAVDLSNRTNVFSRDDVDYIGDYDPVLTEKEASAYTITNVLGGDDNWQPQLVTEPVQSPEIETKNNTIYWGKVPYAICYVISRDGDIIDFTTDTLYTEANAENGTYTYQIQAANEFGGLSQASLVELTVGEITGIIDLNESVIKIFSYKQRIYIIGIESNSTIQFFDLHGSLLTNFKTSTDVDMQYHKGFYLIKVINNGKITTGKVSVY